MNQRSRWLGAASAVACLAFTSAACSEPGEPTQPAEPTPVEETADVAAEPATEAPAPEKAPEPRPRSPEAQARIQAMTEDAIASLKRSGDFLASQKSFSVHTGLSYDVLQPNGQMLEFGGTRDVLMRRPNRLRVETIAGNGEVKQLFFDGKSLLIDMPNEDAYVSVEKPGTVYAAIDYLVEDLGAAAPLEDFLQKNYAADAIERIEEGHYVQHVDFGGQVCEHLAFRSADVDFQIWIEEGEKPLPCRVVVTYKNAEGHPQFRADFEEWNLEAETGDEMFVFEPPESAERLQAQAFVSELRDDREGK